MSHRPVQRRRVKPARIALYRGRACHRREAELPHLLRLRGHRRIVRADRRGEIRLPSGKLRQEGHRGPDRRRDAQEHQPACPRHQPGVGPGQRISPSTLHQPIMTTSVPPRRNANPHRHHDPDLDQVDSSRADIHLRRGQRMDSDQRVSRRTGWWGRRSGRPARSRDEGPPSARRATLNSRRATRLR